MRSLIVALALLIPGPAQAQRLQGSALSPPVTQTPAAHQAPPHPQAAAPRTVPPPILFPLPPLMTPPAGGLTAGFPGFFAHDASDRSRVASHRRAPIVAPIYGGIVPGYGVADEPIDREHQAPPVPEPEGALRLAVTPDTAQIFVDGFFVGTIEDLGAVRELALEPGSHRVEIRAPDYRTLRFDVRIAPREIVTYRASLEPARVAPAAPPAIAPSPAVARPGGPMYIIPSCYMGNVPPRQDKLPAGCDAANVRLVAQP